MSPLAKNLYNKRETNLSFLLHHITRQSEQIETNLSQKINEQIIKAFHDYHDEVTSVKSYVRTINKKMNQVERCANSNIK